MTDEELAAIKARHEVYRADCIKNGINDPVLDERMALSAEVERLRAECFSLAANQCHNGYAGEFGNHCCRYDDELRIAQHLITNIGWWTANGKSETVSREIEAYWAGWRERCGKS